MDPVGPLDGGLAHINRYVYGYNNPYRYSDPTGLEPGPEDGQHYDDFMEAEGKTAFSAPKSNAYWDLYDPPMPNLVDQFFAEVTALGTVQDVLDAFRGDIGWGMVVAGIVPGGKLVARSIGNKVDDVIHVTKDGVALPSGAKHKVPDNYVQNPHRKGNYGEIVDGKYKERLRIDPATPPGQKGPNYSHYHKNGKGKHYSPKEGDPDPGF